MVINLAVSSSLWSLEDFFLLEMSVMRGKGLPSPFFRSLSEAYEAKEAAAALITVDYTY